MALLNRINPSAPSCKMTKKMYPILYTMHKRTQAFPHVTFRNDHAYDTYLVQTKTERCLGMAGHLKKERNLIPNKQLHSRITL